MKKQITLTTLRRAPKPTYRPATLADVLLSAPQRLRADETMTSTTMALVFAAKWQQAKRGDK